MSDLPIVAVMIGDPCGIGPEVTVKAVAEDAVKACCRPLLIGSAAAVRLAAAASGVQGPLQVVERVDQLDWHADGVAVLDPGNLDPAEVQFARASAACGRAVCEWIDLANELGRQGAIAGWVMAPLHSQSIRMAGLIDELDDLLPPESFLLRVSDGLRVVPISEHIPISAVPASVTRERVLHVIELLHAALAAWDLPTPRIAVAGLNPHAMGAEEAREIAPAVAVARERGLDVTGPISPDAVFRRCLEGAFDAVVSMYHDQGQIALKTAAFAGACSVFLGLPYVYLSVPHGSGFDIAGKNRAQHQSMQAAMVTAARLARLARAA